MLKDAKQCSRSPSTENAATAVSPLRRIAPQILASLAKNVIMLDLGASYSLSIIAIPALRGIDATNNADEVLRITEEQASLLGANSNIVDTSNRNRCTKKFV